ncbi:hypothetical protein ICW40_07805 [Actinotalea ferrariae]|uniref:hypothetical protein n=1 Tax=Actinotalea ferrariae TaxID=1386098 RepID=UPI001C8C45E7|nr:hypothetical protein [Actinotalea ferrariae]MBX9244714.1 hypothetical protein [Actinotalea ferrariae]
MSLATSVPAADRSARALDPRAVRGARLALRSQLVVWVAFWLTLAVIAVGIVVVTVRVGEVEHSAWDYLSAGCRWFSFAMLLFVTAGGIGPYVAHGLTRRSFVTLVALDVAVTAAVFSACWTLGHAVENAVFAARGWPTSVQEHLYADGSQLGLVTLEALLAVLVYGTSGALVGAAFYRGGGWWGTLTLPLTLAPVAVTESLLTGRWIGDLAQRGLDLPLPARGLTILLVVALGMVVLHLVLRRAAIRRPAS